MCRILIAEDEIWVSALIASIIKKNCPGAEIVGEVPNGKKALEMIRQLEPDLVLADINMPILSGLEMIERARAAGFQGKFVIISGYKEFQYVQQALRMGVADYLLKPIDDAKLCAVVESVGERIRAETDDTRQRLQNEALLKKQFLRALLTGGNLSMEKCNYSYGLRLVPGVLRCSALHFSCEDPNTDLQAVMERSDRAIKEAIAPSAAVCFSLLQGTYLILFTNCGETQRASLGEALQEAIASLHTQCALQNIRLTAVEGDECRSLPKLADACRQALRAAGKGSVSADCTVPLPRRDDAEIPTLTYEERKQLHRALHGNSSAELAAWFDHLYDSYVCANGIAEEETFLMTDYTVILLNALLDEIDALPYQISLDRSQIFEQFTDYSTVDDLRLCADTVLRSIKEKMDQQINATDLTINRAMDYIGAHLSEPITLEEVAGSVYLSAAYFSEYFKTKTGTNFKDYLLQRRIGHATELIRKNEPLKHVAGSCGYNDFKHFCRVFKRVVGISPSEYRKIYSKK